MQYNLHQSLTNGSTGLVGRTRSLYLNDILIYSENPGQHNNQVLRRLCANRLFAKIEKCEFNVNITNFLGFLFSPDSTWMDESEVQVIRDRTAPRKV